MKILTLIIIVTAVLVPSVSHADFFSGFSSFFDKVMQFITDFFDHTWNTTKWLAQQILKVLGFFLWTLLDGVMLIIEGLVSGLQWSDVQVEQGAIWVGLPSWLSAILYKIGVGSALSVTAAAIGIRQLLNLIPAEFTRI